MVSLLADIAICAAILAGVYFWLGTRSAPGAKSSSKKKKNKNKNKATTTVNGEASLVQEKQHQPQQKPLPKQPTLEKEKPAAVQQTQQERPVIQNGANQKPKPQATKNRHTQGQAWRAKEEFPPLSAPVKQPSSQPQKPLAERLAKPLPKTAVDDMLDREVEPERTFSRTMRIVKPAPSPPLLIDEPSEDEERDADPFGERDSRTEREGAWESVPITSQKKPPTIRIGISPASSGTSTPAARSIPGLTEQSKKQRQNAAKAAAAKAAKDAAEQDRLQRLAAHKRQLERERMTVQAKEREKSNKGTKSNRETLSGGMTAKVAENGALIWD